MKAPKKRRGVTKLRNQYVGALTMPHLYEDCPKAVWAAIAVSALTTGGDYLDQASANVLREWWTLHDNGIVPQRPPFPRPDDVDGDLPAVPDEDKFARNDGRHPCGHERQGDDAWLDCAVCERADAIANRIEK